MGKETGRGYHKILNDTQKVEVASPHFEERVGRFRSIDGAILHSGIQCREDAIIWICQNQRGRRNATPEQKDYLLGKEYEAAKRKWGGAEYREKTSAQNEHSKPAGRTAEILAEQHGVGKETVKRNEHFAKGVDAIAEASPAAKQKILSGKSGLTFQVIIVTTWGS